MIIGELNMDVDSGKDTKTTFPDKKRIIKDC